MAFQLSSCPAAADRRAASRRQLPTFAACCPCSTAVQEGLHDTTLPGKLLLQVDEVVNIGAAVRERYSGNDGGQRCLKLLLTDGGCWARMLRRSRCGCRLCLALLILFTAR